MRMWRSCRNDSTDAPDVILDLESPAKASRRSKSLRDAGANIMQDTNAFQEEEQPESPKACKPQYPMRSQVDLGIHAILSCLCRCSAAPPAPLHRNPCHTCPHVASIQLLCCDLCTPALHHGAFSAASKQLITCCILVVLSWLDEATSRSLANALVV